MKSFQEKFQDITQFDQVRLLHLLEIAQNMLLSFVTGFYIGHYLDELFPKYNDKKETYKIIWEVAGQLVLTVITLFYLKKVIALIPFVLSGTSAYANSKTKEDQSGIAIGFALIFVSIQNNLLNKIKLLEKRILDKDVEIKKSS